MNVRQVFSFLGTGAIAAAALFAPTARAQMPLSLFNGSSLQGWNQHGWAVNSGVMTSAGGPGTRTALTAVPWSDFRLDFDFNESATTGAKFRAWTTKEGAGGLSIDLDTKGAQAGVGGIEGLSSSSFKSIGDGWHRMQVEASKGQVSVKIDGGIAGTASGLGSRAGFVGFEASGAGTLQIRNVHLIPLGLTSSFDGTDLGGWKAIARGPESNGGLGHTMERTFSIGMAGGSTKPHAAKWTVQNGAIKGEDGPGGLELGTPVEDAIIQIAGSVRGAAKPDNFTGVSLRTSPGKLDGGYEIGVGPFAGAIDPVAKRPPAKSMSNTDETIVIAGRTIAVWQGGNLVNLHVDPRPESGNPAQGAKTAAGSLTLLLPNKDVELSVQKLAMVALPKTYGIAASAPPPPVVTPQATTQTASAGAGASSPASSSTERELLDQQKEAAKQAAADKANRERSAVLMSQALAATDPQQQMGLYQQVVALDPTNAAAAQGYKDAQAKVQAAQDAEQKKELEAVSAQQSSASKSQQTTDSLVQAQSQFLSGHLGEASTTLMIAERLSPDNPLVRDLRNRINSANSTRQRLYMLGGGVGLLALVGGVAVWMRRRRLQKYPMLELVRGLDEGQQYALDKDVVRIGAVAQDGGQKNDIVVRDVEHAISRFHCEITRRNGQFFLTDLRSSNGTRVDGTVLEAGQPAALRKGSRITLADTVEMQLGFGTKPKQS